MIIDISKNHRPPFSLLRPKPSDQVRYNPQFNHLKRAPSAIIQPEAIRKPKSELTRLLEGGSRFHGNYYNNNQDKRGKISDSSRVPFMKADNQHLNNEFKYLMCGGRPKTPQPPLIRYCKYQRSADHTIDVNEIIQENLRKLIQ